MIEENNFVHICGIKRKGYDFSRQGGARRNARKGKVS